jgi:hypothetical protein
MLQISSGWFVQTDIFGSLNIKGNFGAQESAG